MEAYRDQYATIFNNGDDVALMAISVDPDTALTSWAREQDFPAVFLSDADGTVGRLYGAYDEQRKLDNRTLYVIGPDGRVSYLTRPFNALSADAYTELGAAIARAGGREAPKDSSGSAP